MKITVNTQTDYVKSILVEYTPTEALVVNQALRRYANDDNVNVENRLLARLMIESIDNREYVTNDEEDK